MGIADPCISSGLRMIGRAPWFPGDDIWGRGGWSIYAPVLAGGVGACIRGLPDLGGESTVVSEM